MPRDGALQVGPSPRRRVQAGRGKSQEERLRRIVGDLGECPHLPCLRPGRRHLGPLGVPLRQDDRTPGEQQEDDGDAQQCPEATVGHDVTPRLRTQRTFLVLLPRKGGLDELLLDRGQGRAPAGSPLHHPGEADPSVQLALRSSQVVPGIGARAEVVQDPLSLPVVVEPPAQPRPRPDQRLVSEGDVAVVAGQQPGRDQQLDDPLAIRSGRGASARHPDAQRLTLRARRHEPQHQVADLSLLGDRHAGVDAFSGLGDGPLDPAGGGIALDGERSALATAPGLLQRVRQQRKRAGSVPHLGDQDVHESGLDDQPRLQRGALDAGAQPVVVHRTEDVEPAFEEPREAGVHGELGQPVGTQRHGDLSAQRLVRDRREEPCARRAPVLGGEDLLTLVDDQEPAVGKLIDPAEELLGLDAGREDHDLSALRPGRRHHTGSEQRRLPAPGGADHGEHPALPQHSQAVGHLGISPVEALGVGHVVRPETGPRTGLLQRARGVDVQIGVLVQDGPL